MENTESETSTTNLDLRPKEIGTDLTRRFFHAKSDMTEVDQAYKEMWANGTWTPEYKDSRWWPQCCGYPMARHNELSRSGHRCYICLTWRPEQVVWKKAELDSDDWPTYAAEYDNGPYGKPFTPPAPDRAF